MFGVVRTDIYFVAAGAQFVQGADQQVEVFIEGGLGAGVERYGRRWTVDGGRCGLGHFMLEMRFSDAGRR